MRKIIIDTDLGCDCDDAGALAVAHKLADSKLCSIAAMTHCTSVLAGANAAYTINKYYGRADIPIGIYKPDGFLDNKFHAFPGGMEEKFGKHFADKNEVTDAVKTLRKAYADTAEPITLIGIGNMAILAGFINSAADDISDKSGIQLAAENGGDLVLMAGSFDSAYEKCLFEGAEFNVKCDVPAARAVVKNWPNEVYMLPFEAGLNVLTGKKLLDDSLENPVAYAYRMTIGTDLRPSWDLCAVHFAVTRSKELWNCSCAGTITVDERGKTVFTENADGRHYVVGPVSIENAASVIDDLMAQAPDV